MTLKIENLFKKVAHFDDFQGSFQRFWGKKLIFWALLIFKNLKVKYLYSLLPITDALLWGPAEALHQEKSVVFWFLVPKFYHPYEQCYLLFCVWVGLGGAYLPFSKNIEKNLVLLFLFFNVFSYQGERFIFFSSIDELKIEIAERIQTRKLKVCAEFASVFWPFWGLEKSYSGLYQSGWEKFCVYFFLFFFFQMCLATGRSDFNLSSQNQGDKNIIARRSKIEPKIDTFCRADISDLPILGVVKVVFWNFSKLFKSCLGSIWALFLTLKGPF